MGLHTVSFLDVDGYSYVVRKIPFAILARGPLTGEPCAAEGLRVQRAMEASVFFLALEERLYAKPLIQSLIRRLRWISRRHSLQTCHHGPNRPRLSSLMCIN